MSALPVFLSSLAFLAAPVWRAGALAPALQHTLDTGYPDLNAALPGGGWPVGAMTELLQAQPGMGEWGLLAPMLASLLPWPAKSASRAVKETVVLVGAPFVPLGPALAARQIDPSRLLRVQADAASSKLWAAEQALRCADVAAVLAWLPRVPMPHLRRLQMAAQAHGKLLFVFRPEAVQTESSPAPLRLRLLRPAFDPAEAGQVAAPRLLVDIFKRRGPPLPQPLVLATLPLRLEAVLAASRAQARRRRQAAGGVKLPVALPVAVSAPRQLSTGPSPWRKEPGHVVGRLASHS